MIRLNRTYYSLLNFTSKIFQKIGLSGKIQTNEAKSAQFAYILRKLRKIRTDY